MSIELIEARQSYNNVSGLSKMDPIYLLVFVFGNYLITGLSVSCVSSVAIWVQTFLPKQKIWVQPL